MTIARTYVVPAWVSGHQDRDDWVDQGADAAGGGLDKELPDYLGVWVDGQEGSRRAWHLFSDYPEEHHVRFGWSRLTLHSQDGKVGSRSKTDGGEAEMTSTEKHTGSSVVATLERVWDRIRAEHPELPEVVITTGSGEGTKWGHFRAESWKVREEGAATTEAGRRHELFLASEALAKGAHQVLQTMLHEAAHTLSKVRGVNDTSRQGRWHNATFRKTAEELGMAHQGDRADKTHGFAFVTLTEALKTRYADLLDDLDRDIRLTGLLPFWLGGEQDEDQRGGERITGKPAGGEDGESKSVSQKAICLCVEPNIIRISQKVLDLGVVRCDSCTGLFRRP